MATSDVINKQGNQFVAFATSTNDLEQARAAYKKILLSPDILSATHAIGCTSLYNVYTAKSDQHWSDDAEYGASRNILEVMRNRSEKNMSVFVCRRYSGVKLGAERWSIIKQVATQALEAYHRSTPSSSPSSIKVSS